MLAANHFDVIVAFLRQVGITVHVGEHGRDGFLPGVRIIEGALWVDPAHLYISGDLLHEAGHLAVIPGRYRAQVGSDVTATLQAALDDDPEPEPFARTLAERALLSGESMALAWSCAALTALNLPLDAVFFENSYKMDSAGHARLFQLVHQGNYPGLMNLIANDMTGPCGIAALLSDSRLPPFPTMTRWVLP